MKFSVHNPDYNLSPYTGMTRAHWLEAAEFFMDGVFAHVASFKDPIVLPRHEKAVSYPQPGDPRWRYQAEIFEGLARTLLIAAPLLKNKPQAEAGGYLLREYYKHQILLAMDATSPSYIGSLKELQAEFGGAFPFQQICEGASLAYGLWVTKEIIWDTYTTEEQQRIIRFLSDFGHAKTNHHNWRYFNIIMLSFVKQMGYPIEEEVLMDHLQNILSYDVGNGWYRDGRFFDYYSPWAFQLYGPIWNQMYGYEHEPAIAKRIEASSHTLMEHYPEFFSKDAHMIMWGRSNSYRFTAASPLAANLLLPNSTLSPGYVRRVLSGNMLQFITKESMFYKGVPTLGFYGPFEPMVQSYSCAASPFWLGNVFTSLLLNEEHPLWSAKEENGNWENLKEHTHSTLLEGPGIEIVQYGASGTSEIRTSKIIAPMDHPWLGEYSRLAFNSAYPWEKVDLQKGVNPMNYSIQLEESSGFHLPNAIGYVGKEGNIFYRRLFWNFQNEHREIIDTADITMPKGVLRVDRVRIPQKPYSLTLAHYGLPHETAPVIKHTTGISVSYSNLNQSLQKSGRASTNTIEPAIIIAKTNKDQLAMVSYIGLDRLTSRTIQGASAVSDQSTTIYGTQRRENLYGGMEFIITLMLHSPQSESSVGLSDTNFTPEELNPIESIECFPETDNGIVLGVRLRLRNTGGSLGADGTGSREILVDFSKNEASVQL